MHRPDRHVDPSPERPRLAWRADGLGAGLLFVLIACAIGCGGGPSVPPPGASTSDDVAVGPITGFGSAFVNDVQWDLSAATVDFDGTPATASDLRYGMVVRVNGTLDATGLFGTATSVFFDEWIEGPLEANPTTTSPGVIEFTVLDTTVVAQQGITYFAGGAGLSSLMGGDEVGVSGFVDDTGALVATRVALRTPSTTRVELRGTVASLMRNLSEFAIGGVTVLYDPNFQGTIFQDGLASHQDLMDGQFVEVVGRRVALNRVEADVIGLQENGVLAVTDADEAAVRGFVTGFVSPSSFSVDGVPVDASSASVTPFGYVVASGDYLQVDGQLVAGTLVAAFVEVARLDDRDNDLIEIRASVPVGGVGDFGPNTIGMLAAGMAGVEVQVPATTRFEDTRSGVDPFTLADIADGDYLEIRAYEGAGNVAVATWIERLPLGADVAFQGPVTFVDAPSMLVSLMGRSILRETGVQYFDIDGMAMLEADFFDALAPGDIVRAVDLGAASPASLGPADELSIED